MQKPISHLETVSLSPGYQNLWKQRVIIVKTRRRKAIFSSSEQLIRNGRNLWILKYL